MSVVPLLCRPPHRTSARWGCGACGSSIRRALFHVTNLGIDASETLGYVAAPYADVRTKEKSTGLETGALAIFKFPFELLAHDDGKFIETGQERIAHREAKNIRARIAELYSSADLRGVAKGSRARTGFLRPESSQSAPFGRPSSVTVAVIASGVFTEVARSMPALTTVRRSLADRSS